MAKPQKIGQRWYLAGQPYGNLVRFGGLGYYLPEMKHTEYEVESGHLEASLALEPRPLLGETFAGMEDDGEELEEPRLPLRILLVCKSVCGVGGLWQEVRLQFVGLRKWKPDAEGFQQELPQVPEPDLKGTLVLALPPTQSPQVVRATQGGKVQ